MNDTGRISVGFVGAGRLAATLAAGLASAGYRVVAVSSASPGSARTLAAQLGAEVEAVTPERLAKVCEVVFLTVPDGAIAETCAAIAWEPRHIVVHCSGALGPDALDPAAVKGATVACFHPLQTFPSRDPEPARFTRIFCGIEGAEPAGSLLEAMAAALGATPFRLEGIDRALYHASAVMVSNLLVALAAAATRLWAHAGLPPESGREALSPLLQAAAQNISRLELAQALTGPVARGDVATVERHLAALNATPDLAEIYRLLSAELLRLPLGHDAAVTSRLRTLLENEG